MEYDFKGWDPYEMEWGSPCGCYPSVHPGYGYPLMPWFHPTLYASHIPFPMYPPPTMARRNEAVYTRQYEKSKKHFYHQPKPKRKDESESHWIKAYQRKNRE